MATYDYYIKSNLEKTAKLFQAGGLLTLHILNVNVLKFQNVSRIKFLLFY